MAEGLIIFLGTLPVITPAAVVAERAAVAAEKAAHSHNVATRGMRAFRRNHPECSDNGVDKGYNYESLVKRGPYNPRAITRFATEADMEYEDAVADAQDDADRLMRAADPLPYCTGFGYIEA